MARKAQKKTKKAAAKRSPAKSAAAKAASGRRTKGASGRTKKGDAESAVEKRWTEYWDSRKKLEDAVASVRAAREALQQAQELERSHRIEFDKVKGTLTTLLDVEPAGLSQSRPQQLGADPAASSAQQHPPKQSR
jgi:hypothetical protein